MFRNSPSLPQALNLSIMKIFPHRLSFELSRLSRRGIRCKKPWIPPAWKLLHTIALCAALIATPSVALADQQFIKDLTAAINNAIMDKYDTPITLIQLPAQGDFSWYYMNQANFFNQNTFDYISASVMPGTKPETAQLSSSGGFPNAYVQLISSIVYKLSRSDQNTINTAMNQATAEVERVLIEYQNSFGEITDGAMRKAQIALGVPSISNKLDYIISYAIAYVWSGQQARGWPPLTMKEMLNSPDLASLLPDLPVNGQETVAFAAAYLKKINMAAELESQVQLGNWIIAQLRFNSESPTAENGGMKIVNPVTGAVSQSYQVGYIICRPLDEIRKDLNDAKRVLKITVHLSDAGATHKNVAVTIEYPGYTMVPITPAAWRGLENTGWFVEEPIAEAFANMGKDVTGFKFVINPGYNLNSLAMGGNFGRITNLLISGYPTITITREPASNTSSASLQASDGASSIDSYILGIVAADGRYRPSNVNANTEILSPQVVTVPQMQQTAFVIGGSFDFPGQDRQPTVNKILAQLTRMQTSPISSRRQAAACLH